MAEPERMLLYALGLRLGKSIDEVSDMPWREIVGWFAYFDLMKDHHGRS